MDWSAIRLFALGIGGAFVLGSALATAYYVGGAEPLFEPAPGAPSPRGAPATRDASPDPLASDGGGSETAESTLDPDAGPSEPPLRRTPSPSLPSGGSGGGSGGSGSGPGASSDDGGSEGGEDDEGDGDDAFLPPPPDPPLDDAVGGGSDVLPDEEPAPPEIAPEDEITAEDATAPVEDVSANVPSTGTVLPGLTFPTDSTVAVARPRGL